MIRLQMPEMMKKPVLAVVLASLALTATVIPPPIPEYSAFAAKRVKDKFPDNCAALRKPFKDIKNEQLGRTVVGTLLGGLAGAIIGSQIKTEKVVYDQNGRPVGVKRGNRAAEGAIAGAVLGGLGGYLTGIEQHRQNQAELQKALDRRSAERNQYDGLGQKLADLGNCRNQQIFDVQAQFEAKQLTPEVASSRLDKIQDWIAKDDSIIDKAAGMDAESVTRYAQAVAVADGVSAKDAEAGGFGMVDRYRADSSRYEGSVNVSYDPSGSASPAPVSDAEAPTTSRAFVKASRGANVRETPSTQSRVIGSLPFRAEVQVLPATVEGWSQLTFRGHPGYLANSLLSLDRPVARPAPPQAAPPRPEIAPGKIVVRQRTAAAPTRQRMVSKAIGDNQTLMAVDTARRTSNQRQMAVGRNIVTAALQAARS